MIGMTALSSRLLTVMLPFLAVRTAVWLLLPILNAQ